MRLFGLGGMWGRMSQCPSEHAYIASISHARKPIVPAINCLRVPPDTARVRHVFNSTPAGACAYSPLLNRLEETMDTIGLTGYIYSGYIGVILG